MQQILKTSLIFIFLILIHCSKTVSSNDSELQIQDGKLFYKNALYTGFVQEEIPSLKITRKIEFKSGVEDGIQTVHNSEGALLEERNFQNGYKQGIHKTWFPNGKPRTQSEFVLGMYVGDRWEWYDTGIPAVYEKFDDTGKIVVSKKWRRTGKIYMNTVFTKTGGSIGLPGSKLCEPIQEVEK